MGWANINLMAEEKPALFCPPEQLGLFTQNHLDIFDQEIKARSLQTTEAELEKSSVGLLLLQGLKRTFPCAKSK